MYFDVLANLQCATMILILLLLRDILHVSVWCDSVGSCYYRECKLRIKTVIPDTD